HDSGALFSLVYTSFVYLDLQRASRYTLYPYTTLFRSSRRTRATARKRRRRPRRRARCMAVVARPKTLIPTPMNWWRGFLADPNRSEEHTSELQSRENLVCRLLLEKKNKKVDNCIAYIE